MPPLYPANPRPLRPEAYVLLPLGSVRPLGWLRDQLRVQADGLTGHLDEFWPDLGPRNMWLGGDLEGWERAPYYLDGLVPLAFLLGDDRLIAKARRWVDAILDRQRDDGWIGPVQAPGRRPYDIWPVMIVLKVLTQYAEATGDVRAETAIARFCAWLHDHLDAHPLFEWGRFRWAEVVLSIDWLYRRTRDPRLPELADRVRRQGFDWVEHFTRFRYPDKIAREACTLETHVVNNAMGIKAPGVRWMHGGGDGDRDAVHAALANLDRHHGQAAGVFSGDEHFAGTDPTQGTELCAVVEEMFALETLLSLFGDPAFGDRLERIAYNALPAANTPDMWAHQYDQQANQVLCSVAPRHWTNNDDTSNVFGLEPNYGCCTANLHQGWPKLAAHAWMATPDGGLAAMALAPSRVTARVAEGRTVTITEETGYPFRGEFRFTLEIDRPARFPLVLRIPGWAAGARIRVDRGELEAAQAGAFHRIDREWRSGDTVGLSLPMTMRAERRHAGAIALLRGPLVFSLKVGERWKRIGGELPHGDWEISPTTAWNYGLAVDPARPGDSIAVEEAPISSTPFDTAAPPVTLRARGRRMPEWGLDQNSAAPTPPSPAHSDEPAEELELIPYGSTQLRVTELPIVEA